MSIRLDVPLVRQQRPYSCWYAVTCMVSYFHYPGPRMGVPEVWVKANTIGINDDEVVQLAANEGFKKILPTTHWSSGSLNAILCAYGPIWCAGYWFGPAHATAFTGVDGSSVYFNDPAEPKRKSESIEWFNNKLLKTINHSMMYKAKISAGGKY